MTSTRPPGIVIYYAVVCLVSAAAFLVFLFVIGGGRPSGPGLFLALSVLALGVVSHLLTRAAQALGQPDEDPKVEGRATGLRRKELEREYQALKRALKELELDHAMGKLSDSDYGEIRGRYRERAVRVLGQLDQGESYKKQIEQDLQARSEALAARSADAAKPAAPACPACAAPADPDAAFCKKCGAPIAAAQPVERD